MSAPTEIFEVVDRLTGKRAMEHVHLTAQAGLDWLAALPEKHHSRYRVQSVPVFAGAVRVSGEEQQQ